MDLPVVDLAYKRDHTVYALLHLASSTQRVVMVYPTCNLHQWFIPFLAKKDSIFVYISFLTPLSTDGHSPYFYDEIVSSL